MGTVVSWQIVWGEPIGAEKPIPAQLRCQLIYAQVVVILGERSESKGLSSGPHQIGLEDLVLDELP